MGAEEVRDTRVTGDNHKPMTTNEGVHALTFLFTGHCRGPVEAVEVALQTLVPSGRVEPLP